MTISVIFSGIKIASSPITSPKPPRNLITHASKTSRRKPTIKMITPKFFINPSLAVRK